MTNSTQHNSNQKIFDKMVRGLAAQDWQLSINLDSGRCSYLNYLGHRCAVGQLFDEVGPPEINVSMENVWPTFYGEGSSWSADKLGLSLAQRLIEAKIPTSADTLLRMAQKAHDGANGSNTKISVKDRFKALAIHLDLLWPEDVAQ